jgi:hypothetical protein
MTNEETSSLMGNKHEQVLGAPSAMNVGALWDSKMIKLIQVPGQQVQASMPVGVAINATARRATPPPGLPATDSL